ncbi:alpha/beta hydrolase [Microbacterium sp. SLBN-146]|uniref:alpha/beta hydrolase n=1 Tax=Microbacterium sp. SLBN-146 TaxID=2768457 RepID=UPI00114E4DEC|nr:alpha/beta hydrolase [Microbacterium sp. SLBN-146]TQJ29653.1 alpha/beta hydrolase family protein [Microbacterium sp. SLBN-146]
MSASRHPFTKLLARTLVVAALTGAFSLTDAGSPSRATAAPVPAPAATYDVDECVEELPLAYRDRVRCGTLTVPERRGDGADPERTLELPVTIIESNSADPAADPLVIPTGGPDGVTTGELPSFLADAEWATDGRDLILIEQRGGLRAEPSLACPELSLTQFIDDGTLLSGDAADVRRVRQIERCRDRLTEDGVDLGAYTSAATAADLAELRAVLGYDAWNLYARSYSSRLALTTMRDRPDGLRAVILDGAYPPQLNRYEAAPAATLDALSALLARCESVERCRTAYPELRESLEDVLDRAADAPITIEATAPVERSALRVELTDAAVLDGLTSALRDPRSARILPFVIDQLSAGNDDVILPLVEANLAGFEARTGLELSLECAEEVPFNDDARIQEALGADPLLDHLRVPPVREECEAWGVAALGDNERAAVTSGIPTLIATGGLDPQTPPSWAATAAEGLSQGFVVDFANMGQGAVWRADFDACAASVAAAFLRDPTVAPSAPCIGRAASTAFLTTADIDPSSAMYRLDRDLARDRDPVQLGLAAVLLLALGATLVYGMSYGVMWLARRRGPAPEGAVLAASVAAAANLAYAGALAAIAIRADPVLLDFGLPAGAWPLVLLPFVGIASTIVLVVLLVRAWRGGDGTSGHRVALSLAAVASIVFAVWLLARGFLSL